MRRREQTMLGLTVLGFVFANTMVTLFVVHHGGVDFIPASLAVGLCFALPLFLFLRARTLCRMPVATEMAGRRREHAPARL